MTTFKESSKTQWHNDLSKAGNYPGGNEVIIGCLQRIADASELSAKNFIQLQNDKEMYKRWHDNERAENAILYKRIASLKGVITKIKNKRNP